MDQNHLWNRAKAAAIQTAPDIAEGFDIGFDGRIPEETKDQLMDFAYWVEDHFSLPVTLWVDFKYNHYLLNPQGKRVGYRFYWAEFASYPLFEKEEDLPVIELAVRREHRDTEAILLDFCKAICHYFAWLTHEDMNTYILEPGAGEAALQAYLQHKAQS